MGTLRLTAGPGCKTLPTSFGSLLSVGPRRVRSSNPHFPQSRRAGGDDEELGSWPARPQEDSHYDLPLLDTFLGRVNYCQRLAARRAAFPGLGWGCRNITLARVGPIF